MFNVSKYPHGTFCWVELYSTAPDTTKDFYADLMDWAIDVNFTGINQPYAVYTQQGEAVAGFNSLDERIAQIYDESQWVSYVAVDDVDSLVDRVSKAGGKILREPMEAFDGGRLMIIQDPTGASVNLWQPQNFVGAGLVNTPGTFTWNELATRDPQRALAFYTELLGWTAQIQDGQDDYYLIQNNGRMNAGVIHMTDAWGDVPPRWQVYFSVSDVDEKVAKAKSLGGTEIPKPTDGGETERFAVLVDPSGADFHIIQLKNPDPWTNE